MLESFICMVRVFVVNFFQVSYYNLFKLIYVKVVVVVVEVGVA